MGAPPGGPVDKSGPVILSANPANRSINVSPRTDILIEFDEWIEEESFINSFFISPEPSSDIKYKIGLHKTRIKFKAGLDSSKTYVVTIGTGLRDLRGNNLSSSYLFAFSTGSRLDHGMVHGRVAGDKSGYIAALYPLDEAGNPEIDPNDITEWEKQNRKEESIPPTAFDFKGEYLTQTADNGDFILNFLRPGEYRLIVFSDRDKDRKYRRGEDELGLSWTDFDVNEDTSDFVIINTALRQSGPPAIRSIDAKDYQYIELVIDRTLEFLPDITDITIVDSLSGDSLKIENLYRHPLDSSRISLFTTIQDSVEYTLYLNGGIDFWGDTAVDTIIFTGNPVGDTLAPVIVDYYAEGDSISGSILLIVSEPVNKDSLIGGIIVEDSLFTKDSIFMVQTAPGIFRLTSDYFAFGDTAFIDQSKLIDNSGNRGADSVLTIFINPYEVPADEGKFGTISGWISYSDGHMDSASAVENTDYIDQVILILFSEGQEVKRAAVEAPGRFTVNDVPAAYYTFEGFIDKNRNGRYDYGRLYPFVPAERYNIADSDTFRVRANWETSGVKIEF